MSDGSGRYYLHTTINREVAQEWCDTQLGVMGTPAPNKHHWLEKVEINEQEFDKLIERGRVMKKIKSVLTPEELKLITSFPF